MNQRLANKHAKMLQAGMSTVLWDACAQHGVYFPQDEVCAVCAPSDPAQPAVGNSVRIITNGGMLVRTGKITFVDHAVLEVDMASIHSIRDWCVTIEPDWKAWQTLPPPAPKKKYPIINGFAGDNKKCFSCGYPNPYPADNQCNHEKGWQCSRCKIVEQMQ